jgi:hypothetical protein
VVDVAAAAAKRLPFRDLRIADPRERIGDLRTKL